MTHGSIPDLKVDRCLAASARRDEPRSQESTLRTDRWWVQPAVTFTLLTIWVLYALVRTAVAALLLRRGVPLPVAVLLALRHGVVRPGRARLRHLVRRVPAVRPVRVARAAVPARLPAHLLLLPQGVLPVVLAVAAGLRRRRAAREVHRRDPVPADPAELAPLLLLRRDRGLARSTPTTRSGPSTARTAASASASAR